MVILMYVMEVVLIGADIWYFIKIQEGLRENTYTAAALAAINSAKVVIIAHIILVAITILLFVLVPVIRKLLNKIDTSVDLGENEDMKKIELEDEN